MKINVQIPTMSRTNYLKDNEEEIKSVQIYHFQIGDEEKEKIYVRPWILSSPYYDRLRFCGIFPCTPRIPNLNSALDCLNSKNIRSFVSIRLRRKP